MKFLKFLLIFVLDMNTLCETCGIFSEKCLCIDIDSKTTEMNCPETSRIPNILSLNEIVFPKNKTNAKIKIENKIFTGINTPSSENFSFMIVELTLKII